jgi:hypothetical protein
MVGRLMGFVLEGILKQAIVLYLQTVYPRSPRQSWENQENRPGLSEIQTGYSRILFFYFLLAYWAIFEHACTLFIFLSIFLKFC